MRPRSRDRSFEARSRVTRRSFLRRVLRKRPRISGNTWMLLFILALLGPAIWVLTPSGSIALDRMVTKITNVTVDPLTNITTTTTETVPAENLGMRLGLDLQGGSHLVYQVDFQEDWSEGRKELATDTALVTIRDRIDKYGVAEPVIQRQGSDRILVQLPGVTDIDEAKDLIERTGFLEFREVEMNGAEPARLSDYLEGADRTDFFDATVEGKRIFGQVIPGQEEDTIISLPYFLQKVDDEGLRFVDEAGNPVDIDVETLEKDEKEAYSWMPSRGTITEEVDGVEQQVEKQLTGAYLTEAQPRYPTPEGLARGEEIDVAIEWDSDGTKLFDQIMKGIRDKGGYNTPQRSLGMFLDSELISSPQAYPPGMEGKEYGSSATITGNFTWDEARLLAIKLDSGALEMPLKKPPLYESEVSATLGKDFINKAILAGGIGVGIIMLFMILYYRLPGVLASLALLVYLALVLAIFKAIPVTLTLAGLAGLILSLGMAVDANILIFERLKEELRAGRTLKAAAETGFNRAWRAIRDSNISTIIICGILYWFGSGIVQSPQVMGFAATLFFGVVTSMFTAIIVTRTFLRFATGSRAARRPEWFGVKARHV